MVSRVSAFLGSVGFLAAAMLAQAQAQTGPQPTPTTEAPIVSPAVSAPAAPATESAPAASSASEPAPAEAAPAAEATAADTQSDAGPEVPGEEALSLPSIPTLPRDLSPWGMFMAADMVVKTVMVGLIIASLITWTIWLAKSLELANARKLALEAAFAIARAKSLGDASQALAGSKGPATVLVHAARAEIVASEGALTASDGIKERVASRLSRIEAAAGRRMSRGTGILATIGSTAPFIGLFGTVWGIMNSFIGISAAQTTNLAIVAPGIAEALLATALGLVAAVPAVVFYNAFARSITGYRHILADASASIERLVSRDLDFRESVNIARRQNLAAE